MINLRMCLGWTRKDPSSTHYVEESKQSDTKQIQPPRQAHALVAEDECDLSSDSITSKPAVEKKDQSEADSRSAFTPQKKSSSISAVLKSGQRTTPRTAPAVSNDVEMCDFSVAHLTMEGALDELTNFIFREPGPTEDTLARSLPCEGDASVLALCDVAFSEQRGMDLFLQILDEKRGRSSQLDASGFHWMKSTMKVC
jgi:hypothetical protein